MKTTFSNTTTRATRGGTQGGGLRSSSLAARGGARASPTPQAQEGDGSTRSAVILGQGGKEPDEESPTEGTPTSHASGSSFEVVQSQDNGGHGQGSIGYATSTPFRPGEGNEETRRETLGLAQEDPDGSDDEELANLDSDRDAELTETESVGTAEAREDIRHTRPSLRDMVDLTKPSLSCMVIMNRTNKQGITFRCVCGRPKGTCSRRGHKDKQANPKLCAPPGYYRGTIDERTGFQDGILRGVYWTPETGRRYREAERGAMEEVARRLSSDSEESDDDPIQVPPGTLKAPPSVSFETEGKKGQEPKGPPRSVPTPAPAPREVVDLLDEHLPSLVSGIPSSAPGQDHTNNPIQTGIPHPEAFIFGLTSPEGNRILETNRLHVLGYSQYGGHRVDKVFTDMGEAQRWESEKWKEELRKEEELNNTFQPRVRQYPPITENHLANMCTACTTQQHDKRACEPIPARDVRPSSEGTNAPPGKKGKRSTDKKPKAKRKGGNGGGYPSDSSESSSNPSSDSEDPSSSSEDNLDSTSSDSDRPPSRKKNKRKTKKHKRDKKKKSMDMVTGDYLGADSSTGKPNKIYRMEIDDHKTLDVALCPGGLRHKDRDSFIDYAADVPSLPSLSVGGQTGLSEEDAEIQARLYQAEVWASTLASANGQKTPSGNTTGWRTDTRNRLKKVKDLSTLNQYIRDVQGVRKACLEQQKGQMRSFLFERRYDHKDIKQYLREGLLPRITVMTFNTYLDMLNVARDKAPNGAWSGGQGDAILRYASKKLVELRQFSVDYRDYVLKVYCFLRDYQDANYATPDMMEDVFNLMTSLRDTSLREDGGGRKRGGSNQDGGEGAGTVNCSHCRTRQGLLHSGGKTNCPFNDMSTSKARAAGRHARDALKEKPSANKREIIKAAVTAVTDAT